MLYIKDGIISDCKRIIYNNKIIFNPSEETIFAAGWEEYTIPTPEQPTVEEQNENIRLRRQSEYTRRSDSMYMAYIKYAAQAEIEEDTDKKAELITKSETMKTNWLAEIELINQENPYITE